VAVLVLLALLLPAAAGAPPAGAASPGAAGLGDRLFPGLGNGGYEVVHYDLQLRYATSSPAQPVDGTMTLVARATQALSRFNLDFAGDRVAGVTVNGRPAAWVQEGEELVVTPARALRRRLPFVVRVTGFSAAPTEPNPAVPGTTAFFSTLDGSATAAQPDRAHDVFPSNDHPRDKASFTFALDVPEGVTAVANGVLRGSDTQAGRTTWRYLQRQPMAAQVIQLAVGAFEVTSPGAHPGVVVRDVIPRRLTPEFRPKLDVELAHLGWMDARVGPHPFDTYGTLIVEGELGFALETQTLSIMDTTWFRESPQGVWDPVMLHELAHSWFGNSVSLWEWSDLWLSEGHASWYELLYAAEKGFLEEDTTDWPNPVGFDDFDELMRAVYGLGDRWRARWGPIAQPTSGADDDLFSLNPYLGGALVLYALRQEIGPESFGRLEREWVRRHRGRAASTADWIALASDVAGRDLGPLLRAWLHEPRTPPMPGHPDWRVLPLEEPATPDRSGAPGARRRR
jgi:aminopeptidase N